MIPDAHPPALSVAWTLIYEMIFYVLFLSYYISNRAFQLITVVWCILIIVSSIILKEAYHLPLFSKLVSPINLDFIVGMGTAYLANRFQFDRHAVALVNFGILSLICIATSSLGDESRILFVIPFSALVLGSVALDKQHDCVLKNTMVYLGDASYSIYLIHNPLLSITSRSIGGVSFLRVWWFDVLVGILGSIAIGMLYHYTIEKPSTVALRKLIR